MKSSDVDGDPEKYPESNDSRSVETLKLAADGLPLVPQPSQFKDDPLVRPFFLGIPVRQLRWKDY